MTTIANLLVQIGADISDLRRGLNEAYNQISGFGDRVSRGFSGVGASISRAGGALSIATAPLADFGKAGVDTAATFQSSMAEISARTGIVGADLESVRQLALDLGADTAFSAQQAADGFLQLLSSGQSVEEAMSTIPVILDAAAASGEDLGTTADVVTDIMAAFGLKTEDAAGVVDVLAAAAGASSADMASLGQGFANVGGVAKSFGLSVEDTAATLAVFSENGIKGAEAGTALKSMLLNMTRPTEDVQGAWGELGISMYDAMGNARPLEQVIADLDSVLDTMSTEEQNEYMTTLAGSFGVVGLTALRGSKSIQDMKKAMGEQASASDIAAARMDTFSGRVDSLMGSVETLMITALTPLMENVLTPLIESITGVVNQIAVWANANPQLASTLVAIGGAVTLLGPALVGLGTAMTLAAPAVGALAAAFAVLVSPLALVAAGIAGLAIVASQVIDFGALFGNIASAIRNGLEQIGITEAVETFKNRIAAAFQLLDSGVIDFSGFVDIIRTSFVTAVNSLDFSGVSFASVGQKLFEAIQNSLKGGQPSGGEWGMTGITESFADTGGLETQFTAIGERIKQAAQLGIGVALGVGLGIKDLIVEALAAEFGEIDFSGIVLPDFTPVATMLSDGLATVDLATPVMGLGTSLNASFQALDFSGVSAIMQTHFDEILGAIVTVAGLVFGGPVGLAIGGAKLVASAIENDFLGIGTFLNTSGITEAVNGALAGVKAAIEAAIQGVFGGGGPETPSGGQWGMAGITESMFGDSGGAALSGPLATFVSDLQLGFSKLQEIAGDVWANIGPGLTDLANGIKGFVENLQGTETGGILRVVTVIAGAIGLLVGEVVKIGSDVFGEVLSNLGSALPQIGAAINNFISAISNVGEGDIGEVGLNIADGITDIVEAAAKFIGLDIEIPDFTEALAGWQTFIDSIKAIIEFGVNEIKNKLNEIAVGARTIAREANQEVLRLTNPEAYAGSLEAEKLEEQINAGLAGQPVNIDAAAIQWQLNGAPQGFQDAFMSSIVNPQAIQDLITQFIGQGDVSNLTALVPLQLELSNDPKAQMTTLLQEALAAGGEGGAAYQALLPMATELQIDTDNIVQQYQAEIAAAASVRTFDATVNANITVNAASVQFPTFSANGATFGVQGGPGIPQFAAGGMMADTGLAYLHAGERVLNPQETKAYNAGAGASGAGGNIINVYGVQDIDALLFELQRRGIALA
jgi:TP901 family phage tail tape measure protein